MTTQNIFDLATAAQASYVAAEPGLTVARVIQLVDRAARDIAA